MKCLEGEIVGLQNMWGMPMVQLLQVGETMTKMVSGVNGVEWYYNGLFLARKYDDEYAIKDVVQDMVFEEGGPHGRKENIILKIIRWGKPFHCFFDRWEFTVELE